MLAREKSLLRWYRRAGKQADDGKLRVSANDRYGKRVPLPQDKHRKPYKSPLSNPVLVSASQTKTMTEKGYSILMRDTKLVGVLASGVVLVFNPENIFIDPTCSVVEQGQFKGCKALIM